LTTYLRDLERHFKTEPHETLAFCFGIPENTACLRANWIDEEGTSNIMSCRQDHKCYEGLVFVQGKVPYYNHDDTVDDDTTKV
jgi:hypothetical protein